LFSRFLSERELTFAICYRPSVCRLSVTFVHPTQATEIFGNVSTPFGTVAICDLSIKILRRSSHGNPFVGRGGLKPKRGNQMSAPSSFRYHCLKRSPLAQSWIRQWCGLTGQTTIRSSDELFVVWTVQKSCYFPLRGYILLKYCNAVYRA